MSTKLLPVSLYSQAQAHELDRLAIANWSPGTDLMERAGQAAFSLLREFWPDARRLAIVCGGGNNGGDGYVVARLALAAGMTVYLHQARRELTGLAKEKADLVLSQTGLQLFEPQAFPAVDVIVDALLGIGIKGEVRKVSADLIDIINRQGIPVLALDLPSGLNGDTGMPAGKAVRAALTITFIALKKGLLTGEGPALTGQLYYDDLQLPSVLFDAQPAVAKRVIKDDISQLVPRRSPTSHKGHFGHVLVVGGDDGYGGAIIMTAQAALRAGAGLVTVATRAAHLAPLLARQPEVMARAVDSADDLLPLLAKADAAVIGPGLGQSDWGRQLLLKLIVSKVPLLLDADALNLLAHLKNTAPRHDWVLTPHPAEAARLLDSTVPAVQEDRFRSAVQLQLRYGGTALLKGAGTLVCGSHGQLSLVNAGNAGMATGGMGDILSGVIGALLAQGLGGYDAARIGALVHALAGDEVANRQGQAGMVATDLLPVLPRLMNGLI